MLVVTDLANSKISQEGGARKKPKQNTKNIAQHPGRAKGFKTYIKETFNKNGFALCNVYHTVSSYTVP